MRFAPITRERLRDLEQFSATHGKFRYCSCMRWRLTSSEMHRSTKESRIAALAGLVGRDILVGVLAYLGRVPVGWCSIAPRATYAGLERYRALPRLDQESVWSVVCFFVDRGARRQQLSLGLLKGSRAVRPIARRQDHRRVSGRTRPGLYTYLGSPSTFRRAGFRDVTPKGHTRQVMRYFVK
jgi:hypothetical protein